MSKGVVPQGMKEGKYLELKQWGGPHLVATGRQVEI